MSGFVEVADRVYVLRYPVLDVSVTLVVGEGAALLVDTLSTDAQAGELAGEVGRVTRAPLTLVNSHHHYDHSFGNAVLGRAPDGPRPIWAHEAAIEELRERGPEWRREWAAWWAGRDDRFAAELAAVAIVVPDRSVHLESTVDIGGRPVILRHLGRGHTAGDLVVSVPDADVLVAGDLIEESGPPSFEDSYPLEWPETVAALLPLLSRDTVVVPGHGSTVDRSFVEGQHAELSKLDWLIRDGHADRATVEAVAARAPFGPEAARVAVQRGFAELSGRA